MMMMVMGSTWNAYQVYLENSTTDSFNNNNSTSITMSNEEGLSKKQQKKLAKKAEKDGKKSNAKVVGGAEKAPSDKPTSAPRRRQHLNLPLSVWVMLTILPVPGKSYGLLSFTMFQSRRFVETSRPFH